MPLLRSDRDLLLGFRRGDRGALEKVYWAYVDGVARVGRFGLRVARTGARVPGVTRADELPDLVQEVFAKAFGRGALEAYDGVRDYAPYLARLAANLLVDRHRKLGRELVMEASDLDDLLEVGAGVAHESASWLDPALVTHTQAYLAEVGGELRSVYEQRFVAGLSQRDAAEKLGLTRPRLRTLEAHLCDGLEAWLRRHGAGAE
jgi:RNA polymerase sigma-70 factor (ECF subfamily)